VEAGAFAYQDEILQSVSTQVSVEVGFAKLFVCLLFLAEAVEESFWVEVVEVGRHFWDEEVGVGPLSTAFELPQMVVFGEEGAVAVAVAVAVRSRKELEVFYFLC
jgi:hypothetical protein